MTPQIGCSLGNLHFLCPSKSCYKVEKEGTVLFCFVFLEKEEMPGAGAGSNSEKLQFITQW